ncbi:MAG: DUF1800 domain-containing protein [Flavobacteriales bacterium]|nr:DUF1800 domain-containing protein [Flavobacteriales bacterium]
MDIRHIAHVSWRFGFGPDISEFPRLEKLNKKELITEIFHRSYSFEPLDIASKPKASLWRKKGRLSKAQRIAFRKINLEELMDLNIAWVNILTFSKEQLREKMALFWHDHFACFVPYAYAMQLHINKLRKMALGNYKELLHAIAKDPAMLEFLSNVNNKKDHPNENFARELLELYTLGRGNYTEQDIKEAARAFTGWRYDEEGNFYVDEKDHDFGEKQFLGKTGNFTGEDIINILLNDRRTATFITRKFYLYFINEHPDEKKIETLAEVFYNSGYDISRLIREVIESEWFYEEENIGTKIKSPLELICGIRRAFGIEFKDDKAMLFAQRILGQVLGHPPNVAGWKDGKPWIDTSTLLFRLKLGDAILLNSNIEIQDKDQAETQRLGNRFRQFEAKTDMKYLFAMMASVPEDQIKKMLTNYFIQPRNNLAEALEIKTTEYREELIFHFVLQLLRQPEYQLC